MTAHRIAARLLASLGSIPGSIPGSILTLATLLCVVAGAGVAAAPAGAVVTSVGAATFGVQPRSEEDPAGKGPYVSTFANAEGNPVMATAGTYAIYWDPTDGYEGDWQNDIDRFFQSVGDEDGSLANIFSVDSQYTDGAGQHAARDFTWHGAYTDTDAYPTAGCTDPHPLAAPDAITCLTDAQVRSQLEVFIAEHSLQKGMGTIFYLLTPPGVTICLDGGGSAGHCSDSEPASSTSYDNSFCSYHSDISPENPTSGGPNTIIYAVIPWTAGGLGDYHLSLSNQVGADECQDGGFNPSSTPVEQNEKKKEKTEAQKTEEAGMTDEEKKVIEQQEALEGPHQEEPNQSGPGPDGSPDTGLPDLIINQIAVEQQDTVTDPLLNAWQDSHGNEATDECRDFFAAVLGGSVVANEETGAGTLFNQMIGGGTYYLNDAFNMAAVNRSYPGVRCLPGVTLQPEFTSPNTVNSGEVVGFDGMESDITLNQGVGYSDGTSHPTYPTYTWSFGDGTPTVSGNSPGAPTANSATSSCAAPWPEPCAASEYHTYQYGGTYEVTLTVTDVGGNTASVTHSITVEGPPPPATGAGSGSGAGSGIAAGSLPAASGSSPVATTTTLVAANPLATGVVSAPIAARLPAPLVTATVASTSLRSTIKKGLEVRYTVSERVAGNFELLLNDGVAKRLGIHGPAATGLPKSVSPSIVIARRVLVTTRGGHSTVRIVLSKQVKKGLRKASKVKLALRLTVHDSSREDPATASAIRTVMLHG